MGLAGNTLPPESRGRIVSTTYAQRVRHALGLTLEEWGQKVISGEIPFRPSQNYEDEDSEAKF